MGLRKGKGSIGQHTVVNFTSLFSVWVEPFQGESDTHFLLRAEQSH